MLPPLSDPVVNLEIAAARQDSAEGRSSYSYDGRAPWGAVQSPHKRKGTRSL